MEINNIVEICVAIDVAILGIAYPIIVDKISNIGDKYHSEYLSDLFSNEFPEKRLRIVFNVFKKKAYKVSVFKLFLILTLLSFLPLIFQFQPLWGWDNWVVNNSAKLLIFGLSSALIFLFFVWLNKVLLYAGKSSVLLKHIIKNHDSLKSDDEIRKYYLMTIREFTYYTVEKKDEHLQEELLNFYYRTFAAIRKNNEGGKPVEYPIDLYFMVHKLCKEAAVVSNSNLMTIEHRAVSGLWLLGDYDENTTIHEATYHWLWRNINVICDTPRLVKMFWENSSQYYSYGLSPIREYLNRETFEIMNQENIEAREEARERFIEFHYALGGLVLFKGKYDILRYFFEFTQSEPPEYVLLPESMDEIFEQFEYFMDERKFMEISIDFRYEFPEMNHLGNSRLVQDWICRYIALLFIRQYALHKNNILQDFAALPTLPSTIREQKSWLRNLEVFERHLADIMSNKQLLEELGYGKLVEEKNKEFNEFISQLRESLFAKIKADVQGAGLSKEKISSFCTESISTLVDEFKKYDSIFVRFDKNYLPGRLKHHIEGDVTTLSRSCFIDKEEPISNYNFFAESLVRERIRKGIYYSFLSAVTKRYLLQKNELKEALSIIVGSNAEVVIVGVNVQDNVKKVLEGRNLEITFIPSRAVSDTFFVLDRSYLPAIDFEKASEEKSIEWHDSDFDADKRFCAAVADLDNADNKNLKYKYAPEEGSNKVLLALLFSSVIYWKDAREVIQINITSAYKEQGIPDTLSDVIPLGSVVKIEQQEVSKSFVVVSEEVSVEG